MHHLLSITKNCHSNNQLGKKKLSRSQEQSFTSPSVYDSVSWGLKAGPFPSLWDQAAEATLIWDIDCHFCSGGKTWWNHVRLFIKAFAWNCTLLQFTFHYPNHMDSLDVSRSKNYSLSTRKGLRKQGQWLF